MVSSVDVAKLAGVSQATVSRVLNKSEKVNPDTVEKVNAAIRQLNYRPNEAARSLVNNRKSGILALLCGPLNEPENADFTSNAILYLQEKGYTAELHIQNPLEPQRVFEAIANTQAEGLLLGPLLLGHNELELLESAGIPYMFCGMDEPDSGKSVSMDNHAAGILAADYVRSLGHQMVGFLGGNASDPRIRSRYAGFMERMNDVKTEITGAMGKIDDYDAVLSAMMARKDRPTAIVAATDELGARAIDFLLAYGYSIPADITIVGIGNHRQSSMNYLQLTSIGLPNETDICREAADRLLVAISGELREKFGHYAIQPELFERKSSKMKN